MIYTASTAATEIARIALKRGKTVHEIVDMVNKEFETMGVLDKKRSNEEISEAFSRVDI